MISVPRVALGSVARLSRMSGSKVLLLASALLFVGACDDETPTDPVVVSSITVEPRLTTDRVGATKQLTAQAFGANGNTMAGETFVWTSAEPSVATVSASGLVTFVGKGSTAILAKARGTTGFATIVSDASVANVSIVASSLVLPLGQSRQIAAMPIDAAGVALFRPVTWTSSAPTVATVSATGLVQSVTPGNATITATSESKSASVIFTVSPPAAVNTVTISPNSGDLPSTVGVPLTLTLRDANNGVLSNRVVVWTTSDAGKATVSQTGVVTGVAPGAVTITATSEGKSGSASFTVYEGLRSGVGKSATNTVSKTARWFAVYVPVGSTNLNVTLREGDGDPDLYTYPPGASAPNCASESGGSTVAEDCVTANPAAGVWLVEVYAWNAHSGTVVKATVTPTPP